ncbi:hypothetical protein Tco_1468693 [Tanacetum coccineum]
MAEPRERPMHSIKDCMEKNLEDDAGEILGVHSQGDCGNVTTDDNEDVMQVIAPEKDSIIAPPSTPPGNDLNIAVESGSSWIVLSRATTFVERLFSYRSSDLELLWQR